MGAHVQGAHASEALQYAAYLFWNYFCIEFSICCLPFLGKYLHRILLVATLRKVAYHSI